MYRILYREENAQERITCLIDGREKTVRSGCSGDSIERRSGRVHFGGRDQADCNPPNSLVFACASALCDFRESPHLPDGVKGEFADEN